MKEYVVVINLWTKPICYYIVRLGYSSIRDTFLSKTKAKKIDDIRKLSHENLISQLVTSNDYEVNLRLIVFISSCFEMRDIDSTDFGILDECYDKWKLYLYSDN